jgi:FkbM family methyltransferase
MRGIGIRGFVSRSRQGFSPTSQVADLLHRTRRAPRFAGVSLSAPDRVAAWGISRQISEGEYLVPGLVPRRGEHVIDIGANIGVFALWATRKGASVTCYEPGPETFDCLVKNTAKRPVDAVHAAVVGQSHSEPVARLYLHDKQSTRHTLLGHEIGSGEALTSYVDVPAISIREVLSDACDLLKVDCEGGEFEIFGTVDGDVLRRARRIVMEFHRTAGDPETLLRILADCGFRARILEGASPSAAFGVVGAHRID